MNLKIYNTYLLLIILMLSIVSNAQNIDKIGTIRFFPQDSSFYINKSDSGHLGFPDIIRLKDNRLLVIYRQGKKHVDPTGRIMRQFGSPDGKTWSKPEVFFDNPLLDERDMSLTLLKDGNIAFNYFGSIAPADTSKPWQIFTYFGLSRDNGQSIDPNSIVQIDKNILGSSKFSFDKDGYWINDLGKRIVIEGVSSPIVQIKDNLILTSYGGVPIVKKSTGYNRTYSRISLFISNDSGKTWNKMLINTDDLKTTNLQEPCLLNVDGKRMILQIRTQVENKYSVKDKMMQAISDDRCLSWSEWKPFDFVGHAPYLYKLSNGVIISAYRDFDPPSGREGAAFIYSVDKGNTWSKPVVFDTPRIDNDSSYPSIQQIDIDKFIIVYYSDNGKAIKGRIYKFKYQ